MAFDASAQAPEQFSYQAVIRDAQGDLVSNQSITVNISILEGNSTGVVVFEEEHTITTNDNGLATLVIGNGLNTFGDIASISWGDNAYYLKIETDPEGGNNFSITATTQLLSVPYALYANEAGSAPGTQGPPGQDGADGATGQGPQGPSPQGPAWTWCTVPKDLKAHKAQPVHRVRQEQMVMMVHGPQGPQGATSRSNRPKDQLVPAGFDWSTGSTGCNRQDGLQGPAGADGNDGAGLRSTRRNQSSGSRWTGRSTGTSRHRVQQDGQDGLDGARVQEQMDKMEHKVYRVQQGQDGLDASGNKVDGPQGITTKVIKCWCWQGPANDQVDVNDRWLLCGQHNKCWRGWWIRST